MTGDTRYIPQIFPVTFPSNASEGPNASGSGSPAGAVLGWPGWTYVDTDTGDLYIKQTGAGTTGGWVGVSGGGSGVATMSSGHGAPSGAPAAGIIVYVNLDTGDQYVWTGSAWV